MTKKVGVGHRRLLRIKYSGGWHTSQKPWGVKEMIRLVTSYSMKVKALQFVNNNPEGVYFGVQRPFLVKEYV